ncbi:hypothetical protein B0T22DRAFT_452860 [Podospora appendiculata]|uniref:Inner kinetochore subunit AME1 domain-containing protein n=1 Tax=Podospora appendiculata TaxID=314037 RepID=A0AAE0XJI7_9PEZI|nr:hypothetical protein B0T22DRAFT_452860 [Podospora appendiculata]
MATSRQERMQERMRGAGRHQVEDVSFNFILPVTEEAPEPILPESEPVFAPAHALAPAPAAVPTPPITAHDAPTASRPTPNTSAKRRHPSNENASRTGLTPAAALLAINNAARPSVYDIPDSSTEGTQSLVNEHLSRRPSALQRVSRPEDTDDDDDGTAAMTQQVESVRLSSGGSARPRRISHPASSPADAVMAEEEVGESPRDAPGSGRRRRMRVVSQDGPVVGSSTLLQRVMEEEDIDDISQHAHSSSPLERVAATRRSGELRRAQGASLRRRSPRLSGSSVLEGEGGGEESIVRPLEGGNEDEVVIDESLEKSPEAEYEAVVREPSLDRPPEQEADVEEPYARPPGEEDESGLQVAGEETREKSHHQEGDEQEQEAREDNHDDAEHEEAQEISAKEAAQRIGRKRPRRSLSAGSPELDSMREVEETQPEPVAKRRRRKEPPASPAQQQQPKSKTRGNKPEPKVMPQPPEAPVSPVQQQQQQPITKARGNNRSDPKIVPRPESPSSPAQQQQPAKKTRGSKSDPKTVTQPQPKPKPKAKKQAKRKSKPSANDGDDEADGGSVPVMVQRFTKPLQFSDDDGDDDDNNDDENKNDIPFANRAGVNTIDVLSKLCEELIAAFLGKLEERARAAEDAASKREQRTMVRALEAFQEELRTRLLEHTIALDTLHALRKRVRVAQKEKLALRGEIMRVRAEREQVTLRMDAMRVKHEVESQEILRHKSLSSAMYDIDLAVERGQAAPELTPAEQKKADLASLELLISRVSDQVCTRSDGGGTLKQIRDFNAFLERAATALEAR